MRRDWVFAGVLLAVIVLPIPFAIRCIIVITSVAVELTLASTWPERRDAVTSGAMVFVFVTPLYEAFSSVLGIVGVLWFVRMLLTAERTRRAARRRATPPATA